MRRVDRRTFLLLTAAAVGTSGCTDRSPDPGPNPSTPRRPDDPDEALRVRVAESEAALITAYRAAVVGAPALAATLEPILRQHAAHLARVAPGWTPPSRPATASPEPSADPADVLSRLAATESTARDQRIAACDAAVDPALARELCLIGASEAQHAAVLAAAAREEAP